MLVFGTSLVQTRDLTQVHQAITSIVNHWNTPGSSFHDIDAHRRFRIRYQQRKQQDYNTHVNCLRASVGKKNIQHLTSCFMIGTILGNSREVLYCGPEGPRGENVGDWITPLVCWAKNWVGRTRRTFRIAEKRMSESKGDASSVVLTELQCNSPYCGKGRQGQH